METKMSSTDKTHPLNGQVALVTGAGRGIGAAIARKLSDLGAAVALSGRTVAPLESTSKTIAQSGGKCEVIPCDVSNLQSVEEAARTIESSFGRIDILVNNAAIRGVEGPLHQLPPDVWDQILNTNLRGVYYMIRAFAPTMIRARSGHIINISSLAGKELRSHNIRVSVICPGSTETGLSPHAGKDHSKMLRPEDIAHAVAMLVTQSPQSFVSEILIRPTQKP
jgi:3-oxoacyl-[acyl-carrier protein] reductase